ncbi:MAG: hypothetical protein QWI73_04850 [Alphaproteobacteria bacterium]|nr:hypothetical protein [Alphaproteobacteria bacterium]
MAKARIAGSKVSYKPDLDNFFNLSLSGLAGAFLYQLNANEKSHIHRFAQAIGGAICAIYASELVAHIMQHLLVKYDLIDIHAISQPKLYSFAGFICGAFGSSFINFIIEYLYTKLPAKKT